MSTDDDDGVAVGHGRPPKHTRFKKGRSGNPYGRPKGALNSLTKAINKTLSQGFEVTDANGRSQRISMIEVTWRRLIDSAVAGDLKAIAEVLELCCAFGAFARPEPTESGGGVLVARLLSPEEWAAANATKAEDDYPEENE
jgi:hypothetical protein